MESHPTRLTSYLNDFVRGDRGAGETLLPFVLDELRAIANAYLGNGSNGTPYGKTLQPTALIHEAYIKLFDRGSKGWNDRKHFFALAAKAMRQILVDHARAKRRLKRGGGRLALTLDDELVGAAGRECDLLDIDHALEELTALDERQGRIVELRYFGGLHVLECAEVLETSKSTIEREWRAARAWLGVKLAEHST